MAGPKVIDLNLKRGAADREVDPAFVRQDEYGRKLYCFLLEYEFEGETYGLDMWAYSREIVEKQIPSIRASLRYLGQKLGEVPA